MRSKVHPNYRDQWDFSLGAIVVLPGLFDISAGLYSSDRQSKENTSLWSNQALCFKLGLRKQIGPVLIRFGIYDSRHISDESREKIVVKDGISWVFR